MSEAYPDIELPPLGDNQTSFTGIPEAVFIDDVNIFMQSSECKGDAEKVLRKLDDSHNKYKFMMTNLTMRRRKLKQHIPDLAKSREMVEKLRHQTTNEDAQFLLSEQVFVKAVVPPTKTVCLWLGADVLLEYPLDEADELLKRNLDAAVLNLLCVEHDINYLSDQTTATEVNMARVYNWDVKRRQMAKAAAALKAAGGNI